MIQKDENELLLAAKALQENCSYSGNHCSIDITNNCVVTCPFAKIDPDHGCSLREHPEKWRLK